MRIQIVEKYMFTAPGSFKKDLNNCLLIILSGSNHHAKKASKSLQRNAPECLIKCFLLYKYFAEFPEIS